MNKKLLSIFMSLPLAASVMTAQTTTNTLLYNGAVQSWTVPCGVTTVHLDCYGAKGGDGATGGNSSTGGLGGFGSYAGGDLTVTPGDVLNIYVGGAGTTPSAGFNGGGTGGNQNSGGGGGATDVRVNSLAVSARVIVAAGGGGGGRGGCEPANVNGGNGGSGGANGANGGASPDGGPGFGAIGSAAGGAGVGCGGFLGQPGAGTVNEIGGNGGAGQSCCCFSAGSIPGGGGGGGGFVGGGGGGGGSAGTTGCSGNNKGGGGGGAGGSNYTGGVSAGSAIAASNNGNGYIVITYANPIPGAVTISGNSTLCVGSSSNLLSTFDPNTTSYVWSVPAGLTLNSGQGSTVINVTGTTAGIYTVTLVPTNAPCSTSGPTASYTVTVNALPVVTATATSSAVCVGTADTLTAGGASTYMWMPTSSSGAMIIDTPGATTTYTVTGTDANGCANTATVAVTVNALPTVTATPTATTVCTGDMVTLMGGGANTYSWTGGIMDNVAFAAMSTMSYTVTGTDVNGCVNTAVSDVTVNPLPNVSANATATTLCAGDTITVNGIGAVSYTWTGGVTDGVPFVPPTGTPSYTCTGTDANGCMNTFVGQLTVNALPTVTATAADNSVCVSDASQNLTGTPVGGSWSGPGITGSTFNPTSAGVGTAVGTYMYTDSITGCSNSATTSIVVSACVGINEGNLLASSILIYPNPTSGAFTLTVNSNIGDMTIEIVDVTGRIVYSSLEKNVTTGFSKSISIAGYPNGTYLVNLHSGTEHATHTLTLTK